MINCNPLWETPSRPVLVKISNIPNFAHEAFSPPLPETKTSSARAVTPSVPSSLTMPLKNYHDRARRPSVFRGLPREQGVVGTGTVGGTYSIGEDVTHYVNLNHIYIYIYILAHWDK